MSIGLQAWTDFSIPEVTHKTDNRDRNNEVAIVICLICLHILSPRASSIHIKQIPPARVSYITYVYI